MRRLFGFYVNECKSRFREKNKPKNGNEDKKRLESAHCQQWPMVRLELIRDESTTNMQMGHYSNQVVGRGRWCRKLSTFIELARFIDNRAQSNGTLACCPRKFIPFGRRLCRRHFIFRCRRFAFFASLLLPLWWRSCLVNVFSPSLALGWNIQIQRDVYLMPLFWW